MSELPTPETDAVTGGCCPPSICSALMAAGFTLYRPHHKVGTMSQNLSNVRSLNKYYRTQTSWWVSPSGEIVNWEQALNSLPND